MAIAFKTPLRGLREGAAIVRRLLDGQRVTYAGEVFSVHDVRARDAAGRPRAHPARRQGTARARRWPAEVADGVHCSILASPGHVRRVRATTAGARRTSS